MALLVRAGRLVGRRSGGGRVLVQTFVPDHEVIVATQRAQPERVAETELARRRLLGLPPFRALAAVEGAGAVEFATAVGLEFATTAKGALIRADTSVQHGRVIRALDLLKQAGIAKIAFGVSPVPAEPKSTRHVNRGSARGWK